jgi:signal peptidase I
VGWEEYAASDFPAMEAEEFGVKVGTTQSGRIVPVGVRADLTDEAIKNQSIKGGGKAGGRRPRPAKTKKQAPEAPRSFMQKIGDSLRLTKPVFEEDEPVAEKGKGTKGGFARSGSMPGGKGAKHKKTPLGVAWSIFVEVVKIFMLVLLLRAYVVQVSQVQGPSMQPTLEEGDRLIVERVTPVLAHNQDKWWISWMPDFLTPECERGDIIVVRSPEDPGSELVKRLIALPGDTIKFEDGNLYRKNAGAADFEQVQEDYLNNEELKREDGSYRSYKDAADLGGIAEGEEILVPQDRIFVLGDNRSHSNDSRRWMEIDVNRTEPSGIDQLWLHRSSIEGRVVFRIYPFGRIWPPVK